MSTYVHTLLCTVLFSCALIGQQDALLNFPSATSTLSDAIQIIEKQTDYYCAYNSKKINSNEVLALEENTTTLSDFLLFLKKNYAIASRLEEKQKKIILTPFDGETITGSIRDANSEETISEVYVYDDFGNSSLSNDEGYFSIKIHPKAKAIFLSHLSYHPQKFKVNQIFDTPTDAIILLDFKNQLPEITVVNTEKERLDANPNELDLKEVYDTPSISGSSDLISFLRTKAGVSVGHEGQNGMSVRGGSPDQNLMLIDGLPIYEASHLGGLSSVFITDAIKDVDFFKSGISGKYGGKLSSVMDVRIKDGNRKKLSRSMSMALEGGQLFIEGPISPKTSFILNGKTSWFSALASPILKKYGEFEEAQFNYYDLYGKVSHWFSPSNRLSVSYYKGSDEVLLRRGDSSTQNYSFDDINNFKWGNTVASLQWNSALSENIFVNTLVGFTNYQNNALGAYNYQLNSEITSFSLSSNSTLEDYLAQFDVELYNTPIGKVTIGANYTQHTNAPSVKERTDFTEILAVGTEADSIYKTDDIAVFLQNEFDITSNLHLNTGLRFNYYKASETRNYQVWQPRLSLGYKSKVLAIALSYDKMSQFIHLLANPGPGLPSDLWIPSTETLGPEISDNVSLDLEINQPNFVIGGGVFYKNYQNLIEYTNPYDVVYSFFADTDLWGIQPDDRSWEDRITIGKGRAYGVEFYTGVQWNKFEFKLDYMYSRSERTFDFVLQEGLTTFPYKYDRPHNFNTSLLYNISDSQKFRIGWTFGTGFLYTFFSETQFDGLTNSCFPQPSQRYNSRVSDFAHLDINYSVVKHLDNNTTLEYSIGIYNLLNRKNAFYKYYIEVGEESCTEMSEGFQLIPDELSIYPLLPQINVKYTW